LACAGDEKPIVPNRTALAVNFMIDMSDIPIVTSDALLPGASAKPGRAAMTRHPIDFHQIQERACCWR
jgi:hypothetical protein